MGKNSSRRTRGRPSSHARLVFEDWIHRVWVRGWQTDLEDTISITFVRSHTGSVLCTLSHDLKGWYAMANPKQHEIKVSYVTKALSSRVPNGTGAGALDAALASSCPALHEFLTLRVLPDGKARTPSTLLLFAEGGLWKACLNERDQAVNLWATAETFQGLLLELEARLTADHVEWRPARPQGHSQGSQGVDNKRPRR